MPHKVISKLEAELSLLPMLEDAGAFSSVSQAIAEALVKHGPVTTDPVRACTTLAEELGEAAEQALKATSRDPDDRQIPDAGLLTVAATWDQYMALMRAELCQLAAYAMLCIHQIDQKGFVSGIKNEDEHEQQ